MDPEDVLKDPSGHVHVFSKIEDLLGPSPVEHVLSLIRESQEEIEELELIHAEATLNMYGFHVDEVLKHPDEFEFIYDEIREDLGGASYSRVVKILNELGSDSEETTWREDLLAARELIEERNLNPKAVLGTWSLFDQFDKEMSKVIGPSSPNYLRSLLEEIAKK